MKGTLTASSTFHAYTITGEFERSITKIKTKCDFFVNESGYAPQKPCTDLCDSFDTERIREVTITE